MTPHYQHTQSGTLTRILLAATMVFVAILMIAAPATLWPLLILEGVLLLAITIFGQLSVAVDRKQVHVAFGLGWIHRSVDLERLASVEVVRSPWYYGWGIRLIPHGWMWNVSGFDAVDLKFHGGRRFRVGSDDPAGLAAAVESTLATERER